MTGGNIIGIQQRIYKALLSDSIFKRLLENKGTLAMKSIETAEGESKMNSMLLVATMSRWEV